MKTQSSDVSMLESGNIHFIYHPRILHATVTGLDDVHRFYIVLKPNNKRIFRRLEVVEKQLPNSDQQVWCVIDRVTNSCDQLEEPFNDKRYSSAAHRARGVSVARIAGVGLYALIRHMEHTHLVYELDQAAISSERQSTFKIEPAAGYILQIKNPRRNAPKGVDRPKTTKARFPQKLQERFAKQRFVGADPPDFLDFEGVELLLVAASAHIAKELEIATHQDIEFEANAKMMRELHARRYEQWSKQTSRSLWE